MTNEAIYSIDDLFDGINVEFADDDLGEPDYQVSAEEDEFIYEMLEGSVIDYDFLDQAYSELYGE
ncbi:hypothetical protein [uncultured phage]|nr:hypothetical protein [uncultured phage]